MDGGMSLRRDFPVSGFQGRGNGSAGVEKSIHPNE